MDGTNKIFSATNYMKNYNLLVLRIISNIPCKYVFGTESLPNPFPQREL